MPHQTQISIVVPVFEEAESLPTLHREIEAAMTSLGRPWEVLYVDDGSSDPTLEVLRDLASRSQRVRVLHFERNCGQSAALWAGFRAARGELVATLDADLQNDPADLPLLFGALGVGADAVSGIRVRRQDSWARRVASRVANRVRNAVVGDSITDVGCSLKVYRAAFLRDLPFFDGAHRFLPALVQMAGARFREVPVRHRPRIHGRSKYGILDRLRRGVVDLLGVRWLQRRWIDRTLVREIRIWTPAPEASERSGPSASDLQRAEPGEG